MNALPDRLAVYGLTMTATRLAGKIASALGADLYAPERYKGEFPLSNSFEKLGSVLSENFRAYRGHVIVAATGLVVRVAAKLLSDKAKDPALVSLGQDGRFVISLASGHLGGANDLARSVALVTGGQAVVTTATDLASVPAMESVARDLGLEPESLKPLPNLSRSLVDGERAAVFDPGGFLWPSLSERSDLFERVGISSPRRPLIVVDYRGLSQEDGVLVLRPPALALGVGCHREASFEELEELVLNTLMRSDVSRKSVRLVATIDSRAQEPMAPFALARAWGLPLASYGRERLGTVEVPNPSETVQKNIGVPSVCEAAAILAARGGPLEIPKTKGPRATCALALIDWTSSASVPAGPEA